MSTKKCNLVLLPTFSHCQIVVPIIELFLSFLSCRLRTQPLVWHQSPTFCLCLGSLEIHVVDDGCYNWYWIALETLLGYSTLFKFASSVSFLDIPLICGFQFLLLVALKRSWYHMFQWYVQRQIGRKLKLSDLQTNYSCYVAQGGIWQQE
jgi:hypothetical protein